MIFQKGTYMIKTKTSFGEYFDDQRDRIIKAMQNKNTELHNARREDYDKRHNLLTIAIR